MRIPEADHWRNADVPRHGFESSCRFVRLISSAFISASYEVVSDAFPTLDYDSFLWRIYATEPPPIHLSRRDTTAYVTPVIRRGRRCQNAGVPMMMATEDSIGRDLALAITNVLTRKDGKVRFRAKFFWRKFFCLKYAQRKKPFLNILILIKIDRHSFEWRRNFSDWTMGKV